MAKSNQVVDLNPKDFSLSDYDNVRIVMPAKPPLSEEDVDAQLFEYVLSGGKHINSISDLDDSWVQANFEGMSTIAEVREAIKAQYDRELEYQYSDIKFRACCDALLERLSGEVPEEVLANNVDVSRQLNLDRLAEMHISMEQFLREEQMTPDQYEQKLHDETLYNMRLNVALDLMADVLGMQVGNHELTEYLSTPDPEAFIKEIRENDQVEEARRAAVRVKAMRRIVDTAIVQEEGGTEPAAPVEQPEEDIEMPDFDNLPIPSIRNANPGGFSIISEG